MSERFEERPPSSAAFPPRELWLYDPKKEGRLEVIYDKHGLKTVDMDASLELLLSTVETEQSGYQFASTYADLHHGQHDEADYPYKPHDEIDPRAFRGLACNKMVIPRVVHAWWHRVFETPEYPTEEGMRIKMAAQQPISSFTSSVAYANSLSVDRHGNFSYREFHHQLRMRMGYYAKLLNDLNTVPKEFQIVSTEGLAIDSFEDIIKISRMFKRHAHPKAPMPLVLLGDSLEMNEAVA